MFAGVRAVRSDTALLLMFLMSVFICYLNHTDKKVAAVSKWERGTSQHKHKMSQTWGEVEYIQPQNVRGALGKGPHLERTKGWVKTRCLTLTASEIIVVHDMLAFKYFCAKTGVSLCIEN